jgi:5'-nucleotidase
MRSAAVTLLTLSLCVGLWACAHGGGRAVEPGAPGTETIAILATNDLHGEIGRAPVLAGYVHAFRQEWGSSLLWLDAGDALMGTAESEADQGASMVAFLNSAGLDASVVGDQDLELGAALPKRISEAHFPFLAANLDGVQGTVAGKMLRAGSLDVGVVGITTLEPEANPERQAVRRVFKTEPELEPQAEALVREAKRLRGRGAEIVVGLIHAGMFCTPGAGHGAVRKPQEPQGACSRSDLLSRLLDRVPPGTLDAVVSGHSHTLVHHWLDGIPVVQAGHSANFVNAIYLTYDWNHKQLLPERARIEGPIALGRLSLHGKTIDRDFQIEGIAEKALAASRPQRTQVVGKAARPVEFSRTLESSMGDLVADSARQALRADFAMINPGSLRGGLPAGPIRYEELYRSLPFESRLVSVELTGEELSLLLKIASSSARGLMLFSGLKLRLLEPSADATSTDLDGDHHISPWEVNRLIEARLSDDDPIDPKKRYTLATTDFLALGGDDFAWFFDRLPDKRFSREGGPTLRQAVRSYLAERNGVWDVNPSTLARYHFEKSKPHAAKTGRHSTRGRHGHKKTRKKHA